MRTSSTHLFRHLLAGPTGLGESDGNCLLAASHLLSGAAALQRAALALRHHLLHLALSASAVLAGHRGFLRVNRLLTCCAHSSERKVGASTEVLSEFCAVRRGTFPHLDGYCWIDAEAESRAT